MMRLGWCVLVCALAFGQNPDPAYEPLTKAYEALRNLDYDVAIASFLRGIELALDRPAIRKDLAYTYLKIGENEQAREQFREAMRLAPTDTHVALEYAFLCYETKQQAEARRIFDRIRKTGNVTAEQAFQNIDEPLKTGIERWTKAIELNGGNFSAHFELAQLAEQRDELELAADHYLKAWRLIPDRRSVLVDLGRTLKALGKTDDANAALLAASRGGEPRASEAARELLPARYPFVPEFRRALELDPNNVELRRELAYLLLRMKREPEAEQEFGILARDPPGDLLSAAQLGFLYVARGDRVSAFPLLERVLSGNDDDLANRVRAVLQLPQVLRKRPEDPASRDPIDAKLMAERSIKAGYMKDALKYLQIAHEEDPADFAVMLKLGWAHNMLRNDKVAIRWFDLARRSPDAKLAGQASEAYENLRPSFALVRFSAWWFPMYSSRWKDIFSYGQVKTELRIGPVRPYASVRFVGDTRGKTGGPLPQYLSESAFIVGGGLNFGPWHGVFLWGEAGSAMGYLTGHVLPDYRGGVSYARIFGSGLGSNRSGRFFETIADGVFISRFDDDFLVYSQNRAGYTTNMGSFQVQWYWNSNLVFDVKRQYWANFVEMGPGTRFRWAPLPSSMYFTVNLLRGVYTRNEGNPYGPNFFDLRTGFWYAFSH